MDRSAAAALTRLGLDPGRFRVEDVAHNRWLTPGIWRVESDDGTWFVKWLSAHRDLGATEWDRHWSAGDRDPQRWNHWAREGLAYLNGVPAAFEPVGIVAPQLAAVARDEDEMALLLTPVDGVPATLWAAPDYAVAARALGRAHGTFVVEGSAPSHPWLSQRFLRDYSSGKPVDWSLLDDDRAWKQPLVQQCFPAGLRAAATWLHGSSARLYAITEALPRVLSHLDFWTANLIRLPDGTIGLLDWAFVGDGAIGEDIGNLVPDAAFDHFIEADELPALAAAASDAYVEGLVERGWDGDDRLARLGILASAVKYDWLTPAMLASASASTQLRYGGTEEIDPTYKFEQRGEALLHNASTARRAITLADELGI